MDVVLLCMSLWQAGAGQGVVWRHRFCYGGAAADSSDSPPCALESLGLIFMFETIPPQKTPACLLKRTSDYSCKR